MNAPVRYYAGIGSRQTPPAVLLWMEQIGYQLGQAGWCLRSGGAKGADSAFESGCNRAEGKKQIFYAEDCTTYARNLAAIYHPAWDRCSEYARKLHGRNMMILQGRDLRAEDEVFCVICWTPNGHTIGGTGQAIRAATQWGIPIFNLAIPSTEHRLRTMMRRNFGGIE